MSFRSQVLGGSAVVLAGLIVAAAATSGWILSVSPAAPSQSAGPVAADPSAKERDPFQIKPVQERLFTNQLVTVGIIDFNEEKSMDVYPPVPGKVLKLYKSAGDDVTEGEPLYTVDSPDLVQAGSNLISAAGLLELTTKALKRAKELFEVKGVAERDVEQATSDQQASEAALKAARDAVRIFGKTDPDMDRIIRERKIDPALVVRAPITGRVTARNAAPGLLAQPGNQPAPYTLSDISTLWMLAEVAESDFALLKLGLPVAVSVKAYPGRTFDGSIVNIGAVVDPVTRRVTVRSVVKDPEHELRSGMFATFMIKMGETRSPAVPENGVVREGDGSRTVWVTSDRKSFSRRIVKIGQQQQGFIQILDGLKVGELIATDAALFLSKEYEGKK